MRQDIYGGLRNALEHGATLEQAVRSFISAGYVELEVREAARALEQGVLPSTQQNVTYKPQPAQPIAPAIKTMPTMPVKPSQPVTLPQQARPLQQATQFEVKKPSRKPDMIVIVLSVVLLLSLVAFVVSLLFRQEIAQFLSSVL